MALKSINPYDQQLLWEYDEYTAEQIAEILEKSATASKAWRNTSFGYRSGFMLRLANLLETNLNELARTISLEMGKPITESKAEVLKCCWVCKYYAENAARFLESEVIETDARLSKVVYEPLGTILGIMPWNFPFWQVFRFLAPTIMAGNVALLKHASNVQRCAKKIEGLFSEAGFSDGVMINLVVASRSIGEIIAHPVVRAVSLTGSVAAGMAVASEAGKNIKKTVLELGGSNSFIILDDADIDHAVMAAVSARMQNSGQSCIAAKRFLIDKKVLPEFTEKFKNTVEALQTGNPLDTETQIGPLSSVVQAQEVERQVTESLKAGAILLTGGKREQAFYMPTILSGVKPGMPCFDEEVFGPVASIVEVSGEEEAVALANRSNFGLGTSIFTQNKERANQLIPQLEDGAVFINSLVKSDPRLPFGGTKQSGFGRELSRQGILEFVNVKTVFIA